MAFVKGWDADEVEGSKPMMSLTSLDEAILITFLAAQLKFVRNWSRQLTLVNNSGVTSFSLFTNYNAMRVVKNKATIICRWI